MDRAAPANPPREANAPGIDHDRLPEATQELLAGVATGHHSETAPVVIGPTWRFRGFEKAEMLSITRLTAKRNAQLYPQLGVRRRSFDLLPGGFGDDP